MNGGLKMQQLDTAPVLRGFARTVGLDLLLVVGFAGLTALLAQVSFHLPGVPVPVTLQTLGVLASGFYLGPRRAAASQLIYLSMGVAGLPVFAISPLYPQGVVRLFGPTGGYLLAFPIAAAMAGDLLRRGVARHWAGRLGCLIAATLVIHIAGLLWLANMTGSGAGPLLSAAFLPFVPIDVAKAAVLATIFRKGVSDRP